MKKIKGIPGIPPDKANVLGVIANLHRDSKMAIESAIKATVPKVKPAKSTKER